MGFSDLLTSSRGPGVIGTLLALFVLVGFGTLYMFVFDEGLQGGQKKIEAVIRDQGTLIETQKIQIENYKDRIEDAKRLKEVAKEADGLKLRAENGAKRLAELGQAKTAAEAAVTAADEAWANYRDEYRASEWAAAVGEDLGDITTVSGRKYEKVKIRKVDHKGIQITDVTGPKAIDSAELPPELQDRFQFDEEIKKKVVEGEDKDLEVFGSNVEIATLAQKAKAKLERVSELESQIEKSNAAIQTAKADEPRNQAAIERMRMSIAAERAKTGGVSRAPQMEEQLRSMERAAKQKRDSVPANERIIRDANREIATLKKEVEGMKAEIDKIKKELKAKAPEGASQPAPTR
jgi:chromosome segregation ATPase